MKTKELFSIMEERGIRGNYIEGTEDSAGNLLSVKVSGGYDILTEAGYLLASDMDEEEQTYIANEELRDYYLEDELSGIEAIAEDRIEDKAAKEIIYSLCSAVRSLHSSLIFQRKQAQAYAEMLEEECMNLEGRAQRFDAIIAGNREETKKVKELS